MCQLRLTQSISKDKDAPRKLREPVSSLDVALAKRRTFSPCAGSAAITSTPCAHIVHAELAANDVAHCLSVELPEIYHRDEEQKRKDRLVTMHTSSDSGDV